MVATTDWATTNPCVLRRRTRSYQLPSQLRRGLVAKSGSILGRLAGRNGKGRTFAPTSDALGQPCQLSLQPGSYSISAERGSPSPKYTQRSSVSDWRAASAFNGPCIAVLGGPQPRYPNPGDRYPLARSSSEGLGIYQSRVARKKIARPTTFEWEGFSPRCPQPYTLENDRGYFKVIKARKKASRQMGGSPRTPASANPAGRLSGL